MTLLGGKLMEMACHPIKKYTRQSLSFDSLFREYGTKLDKN
jgi:hypothetical protein